MQMQFKPRFGHPTETCHYCGRTDIESSGRWARLAPDDEQKVWFCRDLCRNMEKHELGLCTMEMWLYKDCLEKCYPRLYELRFGEKNKNNQRNRNQPQNQNKKKKKDNAFKYGQKKQQKPNEGKAENKFEAVENKVEQVS